MNLAESLKQLVAEHHIPTGIPDAIALTCDPKLHWLGYVLVGLATTGLRIGELATRKWGDFDLEHGVLRLADRRLHAVRSKRDQARTTKGKRDRSFPIHPHLRAVLEKLRRQADGYVFRAACGGSSMTTRCARH